MKKVFLVAGTGLLLCIGLVLYVLHWIAPNSHDLALYRELRGAPSDYSLFIHLRPFALFEKVNVSNAGIAHSLLSRLGIAKTAHNDLLRMVSSVGVVGQATESPELLFAGEFSAADALAWIKKQPLMSIVKEEGKRLTVQVRDEESCNLGQPLQILIEDQRIRVLVEGAKPMAAKPAGIELRPEGIVQLHISNRLNLNLSLGFMGISTDSLKDGFSSAELTIGFDWLHAMKANLTVQTRHGPAIQAKVDEARREWIELCQKLPLKGTPPDRIVSAIQTESNANAITFEARFKWGRVPNSSDWSEFVDTTLQAALGGLKESVSKIFEEVQPNTAKEPRFDEEANQLERPRTVNAEFLKDELTKIPADSSKREGFKAFEEMFLMRIEKVYRDSDFPHQHVFAMTSALALPQLLEEQFDERNWANIDITHINGEPAGKWLDVPACGALAPEAQLATNKNGLFSTNHLFLLKTGKSFHGIKKIGGVFRIHAPKAYRIDLFAVPRTGDLLKRSLRNVTVEIQKRRMENSSTMFVVKLVGKASQIVNIRFKQGGKYLKQGGSFGDLFLGLLAKLHLTNDIITKEVSVEGSPDQIEVVAIESLHDIVVPFELASGLPSSAPLFMDKDLDANFTAEAYEQFVLDKKVENSFKKYASHLQKDEVQPNPQSLGSVMGPFWFYTSQAETMVFSRIYLLESLRQKFQDANTALSFVVDRVELDDGSPLEKVLINGKQPTAKQLIEFRQPTWVEDGLLRETGETFSGRSIDIQYLQGRGDHAIKLLEAHIEFELPESLERIGPMPLNLDEKFTSKSSAITLELKSLRQDGLRLFCEGECANLVGFSFYDADGRALQTELQEVESGEDDGRAWRVWEYSVYGPAVQFRYQLASKMKSYRYPLAIGAGLSMM